MANETLTPELYAAEIRQHLRLEPAAEYTFVAEGEPTPNLDPPAEHTFVAELPARCLVVRIPGWGP